MSLIQISRTLSKQVDKLSFKEPVTHVYNPLKYARIPHEKYLQTYGEGQKKVLFLGMNPGPFGMAQTGVPFGEVNLVKNWMKIDGDVSDPDKVHPKRPIWGFDCPRSEVSGARLWGWAKERFKTPKKFFKDFFVVNFCPLVFMEESSKNRTPDKLPTSEKESLIKVCNSALQTTVEYLKPTWVIGVGAFAEKQAEQALEGSQVKIGRILHPSPASPQANKGWAPMAEKQLLALGIQLPH